jgi:hypothetical protein
LFDLSTWDGFSELPKEGLDCLLDTTALNKKMADRKDNPYRWRTGSFMVPKGASKQIVENTGNDACKAFVSAMEKQGWTLQSKLQVFKSKKLFAYDIRDGVLMLDKDEWMIRGIFATVPKPVRIEVPATSVRQAPDQAGNLWEVARGEGMKAVPRYKRPQR